MSVTPRRGALDGWWAHLSTAERGRAIEAALDGSHLPDQLVPGLVAAGVFATTGDDLTHAAPAAPSFPIPADICAYILTHHCTT